MLPDKMTIRHSNHLFVPVAFVFCILSLLVHTSDSYDYKYGKSRRKCRDRIYYGNRGYRYIITYDVTAGQDKPDKKNKNRFESYYTDSRQFKKKLDAVSRHRNNTQRLPNYNWKPPDKYYGPRKESTEKKAGMEFIKPGDSEQRAVDPRIKKMQEISRQEREKWAAYKRNENGKLALDNVEESTKASKLTNDESITMKSVEYDENVNKESDFLGNLFEDSIELPEVDMLDLAQHSSTTQSSANAKNLQAFWLKQFANTNTDELSNKKSGSNRRGINIKNKSTKHIKDESPTMHKQYKDYQISAIIEEPIDEQNATMDYEKNKYEEDRELSSIENSHFEESILQPSKNQHVLKNATDTRRNFKKFSKSDESSNHKSGFRGSSAKEYPKQSSSSQKDNEESNEDSKEDKKIVTANPLTRKGKEKKNDAGGKNAIGEPLNHEGSFHPGRWGMSVSTPPMEFLTDVFRKSMHRQSEEPRNKKDRSHHLPDHWSVNVSATSSSPKKFQKNIVMAGKYGTGHLIVKTKSRPSKVKEFSEDRSSVSEHHWNLPKHLFQQSRTGKHNKKHTKDLLGKDPNEFYNFGYHKSNDWRDYPANVDLNKELPRILKFLMDTMSSNVRPDVIDMPMKCRM